MYSVLERPVPLARLRSQSWWNLHPQTGTAIEGGQGHGRPVRTSAIQAWATASALGTRLEVNVEAWWGGLC